MATHEFICLANSWRPGGRCVAGVIRSGQVWKWVRPVGPDGRAQLLPSEYTTDSGREPKPFDVLELVLGEPCPTPAQPENHRLGGSPWRYVRSLSSRERAPLLGELERWAERLFGNPWSSVPADELLRGDAARSLAVVVPDELSWEVRLRDNGTKQVRACFSLGRVQYDLPVTDPEWFSGFAEQEPGYVEAGAAPAWFVVSLGEEWNGRHYKIVATVIR